jgi:CxxC-x17-CxxC domain-containing protein
MSFQDKIIQCVDCGMNFNFNAQEQEIFASRGHTNEPKRCLTCREVKRTQRNGNGNYGSSAKQMFPATCTQCGKDTRVPFEPRLDKPVYCSDCNNKVKVGK